MIMAMTQKEDRELLRTSACLARIEKKFPLSRSERLALRKAGISLGLVFIHGLRSKLESHSDFLGHLDREPSRKTRKHVAE